MTAPTMSVSDLLTARQYAVAVLVADGYTDKQIGAALGISAITAGEHVSHIADRLAVDRARNIRVQIACYFLRAA